MSEMKSCSIAELMGISKHRDYISNNELLWWQARSSMKPLPAVRSDIFHGDDLVFATGKREVPDHKAIRDWFRKDQTEEWAAAAKRVAERQKELNEKLKAESENG